MLAQSLGSRFISIPHMRLRNSFHKDVLFTLTKDHTRFVNLEPWVHVIFYICTLHLNNLFTLDERKTLKNILCQLQYFQLLEAADRRCHLSKYEGGRWGNISLCLRHISAVQPTKYSRTDISYHLRLSAIPGQL